MTEKTAQVVYLVDDDEGVRDSLCALLQSVGIVTRSFDSAEASLEAVESEIPACMLVDVRMPGMSGLELQRQLTKRELPIPLVMITGHGDVAMAVRAMKNGALDFLEKPFNEHDLIELVNACMRQGRVENQQRTRKEKARHRLSHLTDREHEMLRFMVTGKSSKQIAAALGVSPKTVDVHRSNIMRKANVRSIAELVRLSLEADSPVSN